jgi:hypothetical protein
MEIGYDANGEAVEIQISKNDVEPLPPSSPQHASESLPIPIPQPVNNKRPHPHENEDEDEDDENEEPLTITETVARARRNQAKAIEKMEKKHNKKRNKKTHVFKLGDAVSVKIPKSM